MMSSSPHTTGTEWASPDSPYFPITREIGFVKAPQARVVAEVESWFGSIHRRPVSRVVGGGFDDGMRSLEPLTLIESRRWVFFRHGDWTAFFDNGARGTDAGPVASVLSERLDCVALRACAVLDTESSYGATIFELYGGWVERGLNSVRSVYAANDGGRWVFDARGDVQPFEEVSAYSNRRIRDRFTPDMLARYLAALGVDAFSPHAYENPILVERHDPIPPSDASMSLSEAKARSRVRRK